MIFNLESTYTYTTHGAQRRLRPVLVLSSWVDCLFLLAETPARTDDEGGESGEDEGTDGNTTRAKGGQKSTVFEWKI